MTTAARNRYAIAQFTWANTICFFVMYHISAMGITAGAHRLWAHKTYSATTPFQVLLMLCNSMSNQVSGRGDAHARARARALTHPRGGVACA